MVTNPPISKRIFIVIVLVISLASACSVYDDAADTAETVDDAVELLQDIEQRGTWGVIDDRLVTLNDRAVGYQATVSFHESAPNMPTPEVTIMLQVDSAHNAYVEVDQSLSAGDYFIMGYHPDAEDRRFYLVTDEGYTCLTNEQIPGMLKNGINSFFPMIREAEFQLLSVVERTENEVVIAGRNVIYYNVVSKLDEATHILNQLENETLQNAIEAAGPFDMSGNLYLDEDTLALLGFDMIYERLDTQQRRYFNFTITQWGDVPLHPLPAESDIIVDCG